MFRRRQRTGVEPAASGSSDALHLTWLRRKVAGLGQSPERVGQAAKFALSYLPRHGVALEHARAFGVVVRRCEHCRASVALLYVWGVRQMPEGLEHVLEVQPNRVGVLLYNRCGRCSGRLGNELEREKAVYLLPEHLDAAGR